MRAKSNSPSPAQRQVQAGAPKSKFLSVENGSAAKSACFKIGEVEIAVFPSGTRLIFNDRGSVAVRSFDAPLCAARLNWKLVGDFTARSLHQQGELDGPPSGWPARGLLPSKRLASTRRVGG